MMGNSLPSCIPKHPDSHKNRPFLPEVLLFLQFIGGFEGEVKGEAQLRA